MNVATTLEIATAVKVSKRDIYELFGSKRGMLEALIQASAGRMQTPISLPVPEDVKSFYAVPSQFGQLFLENIVSPQNIAMYRLAIAMASQLEISGHQSVISAVQKLFREAAAKRYVKFDMTAEEIVSVFFLYVDWGCAD